MAEITARYHYSDDTLLSMGSYTFEGGKTLYLTVGIGSGAFRHPNDPPNVLWTVGVINPNIACDEMAHIAGVEPGACGSAQRTGLSDTGIRARRFTACCWRTVPSTSPTCSH